MTALFTWEETRPAPAPTVGERRIVSRFLLWPKKLGGQWRWLGSERIKQEFQRYRVCLPESPAMDAVGWRDVDWDRTHERMMEVRKKAANLWLAEGGHIPYSSGGLIHEFMVTEPTTRMEYERRAREMLGQAPD